MNWIISSGTLPTGITLLDLSVSHFAIDGTPTALGTSTCTVHSNTYGDVILHITIDPSSGGDSGYIYGN